MRPLDGVTVLSLEQAVAAPFATRQLADLGARVIKLERPGVGDFARSYDEAAGGLSSHFVWLNRSKESLTLDVKRPEAREVLRRLLAAADVFVENLAPGATGRLGLSAAALRAAHPRLVVCEISGYGSTGPYRGRKAYDLLVQAEAGLLAITGTPDEPVKVGISVADIAAGMYAYSGVLTALLMRARTGAGTVVEVSMLEALGEWMGYPLYYASGGTAPRRSGARHAVIAPYGPFAGGDGGVVYLGVQNEREWRAFCEQVLRRPALAGDPRFAANALRLEHRRELDAEIEAVFAETEARARERFAAEGVEAARVAFSRFGKFRYQNQEHTTEVGLEAGPVTGSRIAAIEAAFHETYEREYTYRLEAPVELVGIHLVAAVEVGKLAMTERAPAPDGGGAAAEPARKGRREVDYALEGVHVAAIYDGERLEPGMGFAGPAVVEDPFSTVVVHPGDRVSVDGYRNLHVAVAAHQPAAGREPPAAAPASSGDRTVGNES